MIGKITAERVDLQYDAKMNVGLTFWVSGLSKYAAVGIYKDIQSGQKNGKSFFTIAADWFRRKRTLNQNALLWALLTEYANGLNGGRTGGITPEELYYRMISKYGTAEFILALDEAESTLKKTFRVVKRIDKRTVGEKELTIFKCYCGSSKYDTKEMANLIDGVLDELAQAGIDTAETRDLIQQWREVSCKTEKNVI